MEIYYRGCILPIFHRGAYTSQLESLSGDVYTPTYFPWRSTYSPMGNSSSHRGVYTPRWEIRLSSGKTTPTSWTWRCECDCTQGFWNRSRGLPHLAYHRCGIVGLEGRWEHHEIARFVQLHTNRVELDKSCDLVVLPSAHDFPRFHIDGRPHVVDLSSGFTEECCFA
jgi:hypothetical protein